MVDGLLLATDIVETAVYLATPPLLWMALFLLAWGDEATARESGFGRRTLWLLLPGALLGSLTNLLFFHWSADFLGINVGGGLIPLVLSVLLVARALGDQARLLALFLVAFAVESYLCLDAVLLVPDGPLLDFLVGAIALGAFGAMWGLAQLEWSPPVRASLGKATLLVGLSSVALVPTFASTATVPGLGIVSAFPWYLFPPILVGALSFLLAGPILGVSRRASIGLGYATATFGVLIGADLLREPPLYGSGVAGLYAIGGAGTGDLLYLSGLIAVATGAVLLRVLGPFARGPPAAEPSADTATETLTPAALLRRSLVATVEGRPAPAIRDAEAAVERAIGRAHALLAAEQGAPLDGAAPWLGAPAWLEADRTNLAALARREEFHPADATRAWMTARWIVRFARSASRRCFPSVVVRGVAFLIDLTLLTLPALLVWYYVVATSTGSLSDLLGSIAINAALFGYTSLGLLYFVVAESSFSTTLGKLIVGVRVRSRELTPPGPKAVLVRSLPKIVPLTTVGLFLILATVVAFRGNVVSISIALGVGISVNALAAVLGYLVAALAVIAGISAVAMHYTPERQRLGDLLADTWVVRTPARAAAVRAPGPPAPFG